MNKKFCPKCGTEQAVFVKGFCINCYTKDHELISIEETQNLDLCYKCEKVNVSGKWYEQTPEIFKEFIDSKLKSKELVNMKIDFELSELDEKTKQVMLNIKAELSNQPIELNKKILIKLKELLCDHCMKLSGSYHEAIVQIRFEKNPTQEKLETTMFFVQKMLTDLKKDDSLAQIVEIVKQRKGLDYLIGSKQAGKKIAEALAKKEHIRFTTSSSLRGVDKSGKPKKRFTFCIRLG